jgi:transcriptional enhancer factor
MEYFGNSIEQAVNNRRHFQQHGHGDLTHQYGGSAFGSSDRHQISKLSFEMWVSLPEKMEEALHNYTQLQSNRSAAESMVLENIENWRSMYPRLDEIISHWTPSERCDIVMLDASFKLMPDFPPQGSKLGISLELDFTDPSHSNYRTLE